MSALNPITDAMDRIQHIACCLEAVSDLLIPEQDLHVVNRDKQALLPAFLLAEHRAACDKLESALKPGKVGVLRSTG